MDGSSTRTGYDVTADGQRFVTPRDASQEASATQINVVLNRFEELKKKVPNSPLTDDPCSI